MSVLDAFDFGEDVDVATFEQILEMDEGEEEENAHEFSRSIVFGFLEQAEGTFEKMDIALEKEDLSELSALGHFLKGSSATLGFTKVKDECEKIQHYGNYKDATGTEPVENEAQLLKLIAESLTEAKLAYSSVTTMMNDFYDKLDSAAE